MGKIETYFKNWWFIGLMAGIITALLRYIFTNYSIPVINLTMSSIDINVRQRILSGLPTTLGEKILAWLNGIVTMPQVPETIMSYVPVVLSAIIFVVLGRVAYDYLPHGNTLWQKLALVLLYGTLAADVVLSVIAGSLGFGMAFITMGITLLIYYTVVAIVLVNVYKQTGKNLPN